MTATARVQAGALDLHPLGRRGVAAPSPSLVGGDVMTSARLPLVSNDVIGEAVRAQVQQHSRRWPHFRERFVRFSLHLFEFRRVLSALRRYAKPRRSPRTTPRRPFSRPATRTCHHYRSGIQVFPGSGAFLNRFHHLFESRAPTIALTGFPVSHADTRAVGGAIDIALRDVSRFCRL